MGEALVKLSKKDFESGQEVRWCPGCGDYSILAAVQRVLPELGIPREQHVFISGIGCASRFPYYMNTYGFHTIHGRAPTIATGVKLANPDLNVWVITGDGDALSIGGNHLIHALRRNINVNILLFNNRIYGLTKGQYSPTSEKGKFTKSTPFGSVDQPINPISLALSAGATFVARALDVDAKGLMSVLKQAVEHQGTSLVEIYQNCNVFNDGTHAHMSERSVRMERQLWVEDGKPLVFGKDSDKAVTLESLSTVLTTSDQTNLVTYDQGCRTFAQILAEMDQEKFPVPMGVLFREERSVYEVEVLSQAQAVQDKKGSDLAALLEAGDSWVI